MKKTNKILKSLLTTASAMAVLAGGVQGAAAATQTDNNNDVTINNTGPGGAVGLAGGQFNDHDSFYFSNGAKSITANSANLHIDAIDLNNQGPDDPGLIIAANSTVGSVFNTGGIQLINAKVNDGITLTLDGAVGLNAVGNPGPGGINTYTHLGNITLGAGAGGASLVINAGTKVAPVTLAGTIDSDAVDDGVLTINANKVAKFTGIIGAGQPLAAINIAGSATFEAGVTATNVNFTDANGVMNIAGGGPVVITSKVKNNTVNVGGVINFASVQDHQITGNIGAAGKGSLSAINFGTAGASGAAAGGGGAGAAVNGQGAVGNNAFADVINIGGAGGNGHNGGAGVGDAGTAGGTGGATFNNLLTATTINIGGNGGNGGSGVANKAGGASAVGGDGVTRGDGNAAGPTFDAAVQAVTLNLGGAGGNGGSGADGSAAGAGGAGTAGGNAGNALSVFSDQLTLTGNLTIGGKGGNGGNGGSGHVGGAGAGGAGGVGGNGGNANISVALPTGAANVIIGGSGGKGGNAGNHGDTANAAGLVGKAGGDGGTADFTFTQALTATGNITIGGNGGDAGNGGNANATAVAGAGVNGGNGGTAGAVGAANHAFTLAVSAANLTIGGNGGAGGNGGTGETTKAGGNGGAAGAAATITAFAFGNTLTLAGDLILGGNGGKGGKGGAGSAGGAGAAGNGTVGANGGASNVVTFNNAVTGAVNVKLGGKGGNGGDAGAADTGGSAAGAGKDGGAGGVAQFDFANVLTASGLISIGGDGGTGGLGGVGGAANISGDGGKGGDGGALGLTKTFAGIVTADSMQIAGNGGTGGNGGAVGAAAGGSGGAGGNGADADATFASALNVTNALTVGGIGGAGGNSGDNVASLTTLVQRKTGIAGAGGVAGVLNNGAGGDGGTGGVGTVTLNAGGSVGSLVFNKATSKLTVAAGQTLEITGAGSGGAYDVEYNVGGGATGIILADNVGVISLGSKANVNGGNTTATIKGVLDTGVDDFGKIHFNPENASTLTITGNDIGTNIPRALKEIKMIGAGTTLLDVDVYAKLLGVDSGVLKASKAAAAAVQNITIAAGGTLEFTNADMAINATKTDQITTANATSNLVFSSTAGATKTFTLNNDLDLTNAGTVKLVSSNAASIAVLDGNNGLAGRSLGTGVHKITKLIVDGNQQSEITENVSLANVSELDITGSAQLLTKAAVGAISVIKIGDLANDNSRLTIDTNGAASTLMVTGAEKIQFATTNATLAITNSQVGAGSLTLHKTLDTRDTADAVGDNRGNLVINAAAGNITISPNAGQAIGTDNTHRFQNLNISGAHAVVVNPNTFAKNINITNTGTTEFAGNVDTGAGGVITLNNAGAVTLGGAGGATKTPTINATNTAISVPDTKNLNVDTINGAGSTLTLGNGTTLQNYLGAAGGTYAINLNTAANVGTPAILAANTKLTGNISGSFYKLADGTTEVNGNIAVTDISGVANAAILKLTNTGPVALSGTFGAHNALAAIDLNGAGQVTANAVDFTNTPITNTSGNARVLNVSGATTFGQNVLNAGDTVHMTDDGTVHITGGNFTAALTTTNGNGTVNLDYAGNPLFGKIGTSTDAFKQLTFTQSAQVGDTYSKAMNVLDNQTATFAGAVNGQTLTLTGVNAGATFTKDGVVIDTGFKIDGAVAGNGNIEFTQGTTINEALGAKFALKSVDFSSNAGTKTINLNKSITATDISFDKSTVIVGANTPVLTGNNTFNDTTITLESNNLKLAGGDITMTGALTLNTTVTQVNNAPVAGMLIVDAGANNDITLLPGANDTLSLSITNNAGTDFADTLQVFTLVNYVSGDIVPFNKSKIKTISNNAFTQWEVEVDENGNIIMSNETLIEPILEKDKSDSKLPISGDLIDQIANSAPGTQARAITDLLDHIELASDKAQGSANRADAMARLGNSVNAPANDAINTTVNTVVNNISSRVGSLVAFNPVAPNTGVRVGDAAPITGMSAGDDATRYGVWGSPVYAASTQKTYGNFAGYSAKSVGGTVGFDAKVTEDAILGAAVSLVNTKSKYKGFKSGDKTTMNSTLFSIYGMYQFTNEVFAQGVATYASTRVKNQESRRVSNTAFQTATGKYTAKSFNIEAMVGYNYMASDSFAITPMIGLEYTNNQGSKYTESGTTNQNMKINVKANQKVEGIAGVKMAGMAYDMNGIEVTPEVHGFIRQDLTNKSVKVQTQTSVDNSLNITNSSKTAKTHGNVGVSVNAKQGMMEYGIGYDLNLAKKFIGHQGSLKLRVNF